MHTSKEPDPGSESRTEQPIEEAVYSSPEEALARAAETLKSGEASAIERARAQLTFGRSAYFSNEIDAAVDHLRKALELSDNAQLQAEVQLALAPALSKQGQPQAALDMLDPEAFDFGPAIKGQAHNQRSIVLTELGRLPEAVAELEVALPLFRRGNDPRRECRALLNLGALASMMGELDVAETWYGETLVRARETEQPVATACVEGNLGYVASRRGDFASAIAWYERGRASFSDIGGADLLDQLVAVLELDHARTLLDVGLSDDALIAANLAMTSAKSGGNRMLEMQSHVFAGEALIELGEFRSARENLAEGHRLASDVRPWQLRCAQLDARLRFLEDADISFEDPTDQFLAAGWVHEAHTAALHAVLPMMRRDRTTALQVLEALRAKTADFDVDSIEAKLVELLIADLRNQPAVALGAFGEALDRVSELRDRLGSFEMRTTIGKQIAPLLEAALFVAMDSPRASEASGVVDRARAVLFGAGRGARAPVDDAAIARLRDARVALEETKLSGGDVAQALETLADREAELLRDRRKVSAAATSTARRAIAPVAVHDLPDDTTFLTYFHHDRGLVGIRSDHRGTSLHECGSINALKPLVRAQLSALRRLADERRRSEAPRSLSRLIDTSRVLDDLLIAPMNVETSRVVMCPDAVLGDLSWVALDSLRDVAVTIAPCISLWAEQADTLQIQRTAFLGGPRLAHSENELRDLSDAWGCQTNVAVDATCAAALDALVEADFVHIAAHGEFRADNPYFSSIVFHDGPLSVFRLAQLEHVASVVVLASCDAAATTSDRSNLVVSTATELRQLGAAAVIAPSVTLNDAASVDFFTQLYQRLNAGLSIDEAMLAARRDLRDSPDPGGVAAAAALQVFGGRQTRAAFEFTGD